MGKTKIKKIEEDITPVIANEAKQSDPEEIAASPSTNAQDPRNDEFQAKRAKTSNKKAKKGQIKFRSKKYKQAVENVEKNQRLPAMEAVIKAQSGSYSKFEGTIETHINTNSKNLRGLLNMPFARGKKLRILAFGSDAEKSGAELIRTDEKITEIEKGKIDFDIMVTTPQWMPKLAKTAKILGPRGLMPNPKNGTISENLEKTVAELQGGKTEYKTEANGQVIHLSVGKVSQKPEEIIANLKVIYNTIGRSKIQKISLSPTMGPSVKVDLSTLN